MRKPTLPETKSRSCATVAVAESEVTRGTPHQAENRTSNNTARQKSPMAVAMRICRQPVSRPETPFPGSKGFTPFLSISPFCQVVLRYFLKNPQSA